LPCGFEQVFSKHFPTKAVKTNEKGTKIKVEYLACFEHLIRNIGTRAKGVKTQKRAQKPLQKTSQHT
jgi:hypothetical protein